jgi:ribosomal protein L24
MARKVTVRVGDGVVFTYGRDKGELRYGTITEFNRRCKTITLMDHTRNGEFRQFSTSKMNNFRFWGLPIHASCSQAR